MKTSLKKLAGAMALMAAGSVPAYAEITAVPAPAALVPLWVNANVSSNLGENIAASSSVRVVTPKSVGSDTVINLLAGSLTPSNSWNTSTAAVAANPKIHWVVMNQNSAEVIDGTFAVSPDDEFSFSAADMPCLVAKSGVVNTTNSGGAAATNCTTQSGSYNPGTYYLLLVNDAAYQGGAPVFQFAVDAFYQGASIPVMPLADAADTTTYPTPTNNVIENYTGTSAGGPISSPIHSGIRMNSTNTAFTYRVVDVPVARTTSEVVSSVTQRVAHNNTLVLWNDHNTVTSIVNGVLTTVPGAQARLFTVDNNENVVSNGVVTFNNQLNIFALGSPNPALQNGYQNYPLGDVYTNMSALGANAASLANGGLAKLVFNTPALPAAAVTLPSGAYSATVAFTLTNDIITGGSVTTYTTPEAEFAIDTGFFTTN